MDGYCYRCGVFALLSLVTYWCRACTEAWPAGKGLSLKSGRKTKVLASNRLVSRRNA